MPLGGIRLSDALTPANRARIQEITGHLPDGAIELEPEFWRIRQEVLLRRMSEHYGAAALGLPDSAFAKALRDFNHVPAAKDQALMFLAESKGLTRKEDIPASTPTRRTVAMPKLPKNVSVAALYAKLGDDQARRLLEQIIPEAFAPKPIKVGPDNLRAAIGLLAGDVLGKTAIRAVPAFRRYFAEHSIQTDSLTKWARSLLIEMGEDVETIPSLPSGNGSQAGHGTPRLVPASGAAKIADAAEAAITRENMGLTPRELVDSREMQVLVESGEIVFLKGQDASKVSNSLKVRKDRFEWVDGRWRLPTTD